MKITRKKIGDIAQVVAGQSPPSNTYNKVGNGMPFFQGKTDFTERHPIIRTWCTTPAKIALPNDILISVRAPVGPVNICNVKSCIGRGLSAIRAHNNISSEYLYFYLKTNERRIARLGVGSTFEAITQKDVTEFKIALPEEYQDQIRIATVLSKAETLIAHRKESLLLLDKLVTDTFLRLFGAFLKNEANYVLITDVVDFIDYRGKTPVRVERGIPLISAKCVRRGYFDEQRLDYIEPETYKEIMTRGFPEAGDVLFTTEGATMGFTCRIPAHFKKFAVGQRLITLKCKEGNSPTVLEFILNHPFIQGKIIKKATGSAAIGIRSAEFAKIRIPNPRVELQTQFAQIIEKVEALKAHYQASLRELENLYGALSQRAFKGELDLNKVALKIPPINIKSAETVGTPTVTHKSSPAMKKLRTGIMATTTGKLYEDLSRIIKESFDRFDFRFEDINTFLEDNSKKDAIVYKYFTSEEQKRSKTEQEPDIKAFIFDCIEGNNDHLRIEQFYYDALNDPELANIRLKSGREEALLKIREKRLKHEDFSGIYFRVIE